MSVTEISMRIYMNGKFIYLLYMCCAPYINSTWIRKLTMENGPPERQRSRRSGIYYSSEHF